MIDRDEIIKLAREAKVFIPRGSQEAVAIQELERFAALVSAAEREACAKLCESRYIGDNNREDMEARRCAEAIRAMGKQ